MFVGIDVSKDRLDVFVRPTGEVIRVGNDDEGHAALAKRLVEVNPELTVLEATGGYQVGAVCALALAGVPVAVVNPRQVRDFAKALGQLAKTDALDAEVLAHFAEVARPSPKPLPDEATRTLQAMVTRRRQLVEMLTAESNRLGASPSGMRHHIAEHIRWLKRQLGDIDRDIGKTLRDSPVWREKENLLRSVPGVGPVLTVTLLCELPELAGC